MTHSRPSLKLALHALLILAASVLFAMHFAHLSADFPNQSPWMDWSKYTDEGWYGDAAIRHFQLGHWYVPGDFNPAAALPVWPLTEAILFRFTGVSLVAARALTVCVFGASLWASWFLLAGRRRATGGGSNPLSASVAVLLLAASPFCFVFVRMAIIEPMLILLTLLALLAASRSQTRVTSSAPKGWMANCQNTVRSNLGTVVALGLLLPAMVLTKTTALFLTPAVFWMLFARSNYRVRAFLQIAIPIGTFASVVWASYFYLVIRPHYLADYRYLFSANAYTGITRQNFVAVLVGTVKDGRWIGSIVYPLAVTAVLVAAAHLRRLAAYPLQTALLLWIGGYMAFLAYHNNLQPRYYLVVAVPLTLLLPIVAEDQVRPWLARCFERSPWLRMPVLFVGVAAVLAILLPDIRQTVTFLRRPQYTLVAAASQVAGYIRADQAADPTHNPLMLSISGSDISLMTGLPSICDDFGTLELVDRIRRYNPGWYVAWNQVEDDKMDAIWPQYTLRRVAAFPAMDDPDRNLLVLYKMYQAGSAPPATPHPRRRPRIRQLKVGQQPSPTQLVH